MNKHIVTVHEDNKPLKSDFYDYSCSQKCHMFMNEICNSNLRFKTTVYFVKSQMRTHVTMVHEGKIPFFINTAFR